MPGDIQLSLLSADRHDIQDDNRNYETEVEKEMEEEDDEIDEEMSAHSDFQVESDYYSPNRFNLLEDGITSSTNNAKNQDH